MKKYYIVQGNFANSYQLFWATDATDAVALLEEYPNAEQITRKQAIAYARAERNRRKLSPSSSGYADAYIYPYGATCGNPADVHLHTDSTGVVVE